MKFIMTETIKRQRARFYIYKKNQIAKLFYTKSKTIFKNKDNFRYVLYTTNLDTLRYTILHIFLKLPFICNKHDTLFFVEFLYIQKSDM